MEESMRTFLVAFAALALTACTSGTVAFPPSEAAWNLKLAAGSSSTCTVAGVAATFGTVTDSSSAPVASEVGDNVNEWTTCTVFERTPGTFSVGTVTEQGNPNGTSFGVTIDSLSASATEASPSTGTLSFSAPSINNALLSGTCNFYFKNPGPAGEGVSDGALWCAYSCPSLTMTGGDAPETCAIEESFLFYRNCGTTTPMAK
jgi:hypothetical protein